MLDNWRTAPIHEKLQVTLGFLEQVTLAPSTVGPGDVASLRAAGVSGWKRELGRNGSRSRRLPMHGGRWYFLNVDGLRVSVHVEMPARLAY